MNQKKSKWFPESITTLIIQEGKRQKNALIVYFILILIAYAWIYIEPAMARYSIPTLIFSFIYAPWVAWGFKVETQSSEDKDDCLLIHKWIVNLFYLFVAFVFMRTLMIGLALSYDLPVSILASVNILGFVSGLALFTGTAIFRLISSTQRIRPILIGLASLLIEGLIVGFCVLNQYDNVFHWIVVMGLGFLAVTLVSIGCILWASRYPWKKSFILIGVGILLSGSFFLSGTMIQYKPDSITIHTLPFPWDSRLSLHNPKAWNGHLYVKTLTPHPVRELYYQIDNPDDENSPIVPITARIKKENNLLYLASNQIEDGILFTYQSHSSIFQIESWDLNKMVSASPVAPQIQGKTYSMITIDKALQPTLLIRTTFNNPFGDRELVMYRTREDRYSYFGADETKEQNAVLYSFGFRPSDFSINHISAITTAAMQWIPEIGPINEKYSLGITTTPNKNRKYLTLFDSADSKNLIPIKTLPDVKTFYTIQNGYLYALGTKYVLEVYDLRTLPEIKHIATLSVPWPNSSSLVFNVQHIYFDKDKNIILIFTRDNAFVVDIQNPEKPKLIKQVQGLGPKNKDAHFVADLSAHKFYFLHEEGLNQLRVYSYSYTK